MSARRGEAGFTLLEMIVATAIFGIVALTAGMALHAVASSWSRLQARNAQIERLLAIDRVMDSALRCAIPFTWPTENGERPIFVGDADKISLAYLHRVGDPDDGGIRFMRLTLDGSKLLATYRKTPFLPGEDDGGGEATRVEVLATDVSEMSFLYAERVDGAIEWSKDWDEDENLNLPLAIQITIKWKDGAEERWLRRTAGSGPAESLGVRRQVTK